jgi:hypothetical protein
MRKTMRKVTMVVPVLMTSYQVSLKAKSGPVTSQTAMTRTAREKVTERPANRDAPLVNLA